MSSDHQKSSFEHQEDKDALVVNDPPRFDLEAYITNYTGRTQIDRLLHISFCSVPLARESLKLLIKILKQGSDTTRYRHAVLRLQKMAPNDPDAVLDEEWVDSTNRRMQAEMEKIEAALKSYKHNLIKESIRLCNEDLGNVYYYCGDLTNAFRSYSRMRDFCTSPKHILAMSLLNIRVCIEQRNYVAVQSFVTKIRSLPKTSDEEEEALRPKMSVVMGLSHLFSKSFLAAARCFLDCPPTLGNTYNQIISSNDVATYGGLCALASMNRNSLKTEVLDNIGFRNFLELEPHMRRAISYFYTAKYSECLQILEEYKNDYLLDIHLSHHVSQLYESIRSKAIVEYFIPFSCVKLENMAEAFAIDEENFQRELINMINSGKLDARVDTRDRLLVARETDLRSSVHQNVLNMTDEYERMTRLKLVRINMIRAGLEVKGPKFPQNHNQIHMDMSGSSGAGRLPNFFERYSA